MKQTRLRSIARKEQSGKEVVKQTSSVRFSILSNMMITALFTFATKAYRTYTTVLVLKRAPNFSRAKSKKRRKEAEKQNHEKKEKSYIITCWKLFRAAAWKKRWSVWGKDTFFSQPEGGRNSSIESDWVLPSGELVAADGSPPFTVVAGLPALLGLLSSSLAAAVDKALRRKDKLPGCCAAASPSVGEQKCRGGSAGGSPLVGDKDCAASVAVVNHSRVDESASLLSALLLPKFWRNSSSEGWWGATFGAWGVGRPACCSTGVFRVGDPKSIGAFGLS